MGHQKNADYMLDATRFLAVEVPSETPCLIQQQQQEQQHQRKQHQSAISFRPEIDGLRCVAVIPVIFYHYELGPFTGGFGGVDVFFVISGFLVSSIIITELVIGKFNAFNFYERRIRRLFPAMLTLFAACLIASFFLFMTKEDFQESCTEIFYALMIYINFYFYSNSQTDDEKGYWGDKAQTWPLTHFWSLAVEEQFYLLTPLLLWVTSIFIYKQKSNKLIRPAFEIHSHSHNTRFLVATGLLLLCLSTVSFVFSVYFTLSGGELENFAFYLLPCRAWELGIGALLAVLIHPNTIESILPVPSLQSSLSYIPINTSTTDESRTDESRTDESDLQRDSHPTETSPKTLSRTMAFTVLLEIAGWCGLGMIFYCYLIWDHENAHFPGYNALLPCMGTALFIGANYIRIIDSYESTEKNKEADSGSRIWLSSGWLLSCKPFVYIGSISYSMYLWHWPIWVFGNYYLLKFDGIESMPVSWKLLCIICTVTVANLSTSYIENPVRRNKTVFTSRVVWIGYCLAWLAFISTLLWIGYFSPVEPRGLLLDKYLQDSVMNKGGHNHDNNITKIMNKGGQNQDNNITKIIGDSNISKANESINLTHGMDEAVYLPYCAKDGDVDIEGWPCTSPYTDVDESIIENYSMNIIEHSVKVYGRHTELGEEYKPSPSSKNCIALVGSSHALHHATTIERLAKQHDVGVLHIHKGAWCGAFNSTSMLIKHGKDGRDWIDEIRSEALKKYNAKIIIYSDVNDCYLPEMFGMKGKEPMFKDLNYTIHFLLKNLDHSSDLIINNRKYNNSDYNDSLDRNITARVVVLEDTPYLGFDTPRAILDLKKEYIANENSWRFMKTIPSRKDRSRELDNMLEKFVFDTQTRLKDSDKVKFYRTKQYYMNATTGYIQLAGSEVDGRIIYADSSHVNHDGSWRLQALLEEKVFKLADQLCK